jgi:hypothetical protein
MKGGRSLSDMEMEMVSSFLSFNHSFDHGGINTKTWNFEIRGEKAKHKNR